MALGAGDVLGQEDLGHERDVIEFHVFVPEVVSGGRVFPHRTGGGNHFVNQTVIGFVLMNGVFQPTCENFGSGFASGHFRLDAKKIGEVVEGVTDVALGGKEPVDQIGSFARPLVIDEVNQFFISRYGTGQVDVNATGE